MGAIVLRFMMDKAVYGADTTGYIRTPGVSEATAVKPEGGKSAPTVEPRR